MLSRKISDPLADAAVAFNDSLFLYVDVQCLKRLKLERELHPTAVAATVIELAVRWSSLRLGPGELRRLVLVAIGGAIDS